MRRAAPISFRQWLKRQAWHYRRGSRRDAVASLAYMDVDLPNSEFPNHAAGTGARAILRDCRRYVNASWSDPAVDAERCEMQYALTAAVREYFAAYPLPKPPKGENDTAELVRQIEDIYRNTGLRVSPVKGSVTGKETYNYG